jgi:hypothetical protein
MTFKDVDSYMLTNLPTCIPNTMSNLSGSDYIFTPMNCVFSMHASDNCSVVLGHSDLGRMRKSGRTWPPHAAQ